MTDPSLKTPDTESAERRVRHAADRVEAASMDAADQIADSARRTASHVKATAHDTAETQIDNAASGLQATASRLRDVAGEVHGQDQWLQTALNRAAGGVEAAGDYLSGERLGTIVSDAQHVARRNPAAFMGGAAALGFVLARIGKATMEHVDTGSNRTARAYDGTSHGHEASPVSASARDGVTAIRPVDRPVPVTDGYRNNPSHVPGGHQK